MKNKNINWHIVIFPFCIVVALAVIVTTFPVRAEEIINNLFNVFGNRLGVFYIFVGLFVFLGSIIIASSRYGKIRLGNNEKPLYGNFKWGSMIFMSTMAADIIYWSLIEWAYYYQSNPMGAFELSQAQRQQIASTYPLFHWGPIPWSFYILPATAYAYLFFVKGKKRVTLSEACRPLLKHNSDRIVGKLIDTIAVVGLLGAIATTFATTTPLISSSINRALGLNFGNGLTISILIFVGFIFTLAVLLGMKYIARLAMINVVLFVILFLFVLFFGPTRFIIESGISGMGNLVQNFAVMATWTDPLRITGDGYSGFPQDWTIFYWAYWIAYFVATPFFIAKISEGRTIRNMIFGAFFYGIAGTFTSFIVFGNFGLYQQVSGAVDTVALLESGTPPAEVILYFFEQLPFTGIILALLAVTLVVFYASTFDAITLVVASFCMKKLPIKSMPAKWLRLFWSLVFIILPITLIWLESTLEMLKTVSIIAAFPTAFILLMVIFSFIKELKNSPNTKETDHDNTIPDAAGDEI